MSIESVKQIAAIATCFWWLIYNGDEFFSADCFAGVSQIKAPIAPLAMTSPPRGFVIASHEIINWNQIIIGEAICCAVCFSTDENLPACVLLI